MGGHGMLAGWPCLTQFKRRQETMKEQVIQPSRRERDDSRTGVSTACARFRGVGIINDVVTHRVRSVLMFRRRFFSATVEI
jgi:hypothetical protein